MNVKIGPLGDFCTWTLKYFNEAYLVLECSFKAADLSAFEKIKFYIALHAFQ